MAKNTLAVPQAAQALDQLKAEVASELGIEVGAEQSSRANGAVGGQMVKRMIQIAEASLSGQK